MLTSYMMRVILVKRVFYDVLNFARCAYHIGYYSGSAGWQHGYYEIKVTRDMGTTLPHHGLDDSSILGFVMPKFPTGEIAHAQSKVGTHPASPHFFSIPQMRYQNAYVWLVFVSALDIMLTALVLFAWHGREVNPMASLIISTMGFAWVVVFKFATMMTAIVICEVVGRNRDLLGRVLAFLAVMINSFPVIYTFCLLTKAGLLPDVPEPVLVVMRHTQFLFA